MGLHLAWPDAEIVGVDINPQPRFPFSFIQDDALTYSLEGFDFIWASPPCQAYTIARKIMGRSHPDLIGPVRDRLELSGAPYCIENVPGAPLRDPAMLCGSMFGLGVRRHRLFECAGFDIGLVPPCKHSGKVVTPFGKARVKGARLAWAKAMDIDWMGNERELANAIPPAYSEFIARNMRERQSRQG